MNLSVVQIGGHTLLGDLQDDILKKPLMVFVKMIEPGKMGVNFHPLFAEPADILLENVDYSYVVTEEAVIQKYIEMTTGLSIVKIPTGKNN